MGGRCTKDSKLKPNSDTSKDKDIINIDDKKSNSVKESSINVIITSIVEVQPKVCNV